MTASNAPLVSSTPFATVPIALADKNNWVTIDVTDIVQAWLDGVQTNFGIAIRPNASDGIHVTLDSKETTSTSHPMELVVVPSSVDISVRVRNSTHISVPDDTTTISIGTHYTLVQGDYVTVDVRQNSGGSLNVETNEGDGLEFGMVKLP